MALKARGYHGAADCRASVSSSPHLQQQLWHSCLNGVHFSSSLDETLQALIQILLVYFTCKYWGYPVLRLGLSWLRNLLVINGLSCHLQFKLNTHTPFTHTVIYLDWTWKHKMYDFLLRRCKQMLGLGFWNFKWLLLLFIVINKKKLSLIRNVKHLNFLI